MRTFSAPINTVIAAGPPWRTASLLYIASGAGHRFTDHPTDLAWGGFTWTKNGFSPGSTILTDSGEQGVELTFDNVGQVITGIALNEAIRNMPVTLYLALIDPATDLVLDAFIRVQGVTGQLEWVEEGSSAVATWAIIPDRTNANGVAPPGEYSNLCAFVAKNFAGGGYKGTYCKYAGGLTACDGTFADCTTHANTVNFGGFRFLPVQGFTLKWGEAAYVAPMRTSYSMVNGKWVKSYG